LVGSGWERPGLSTPVSLSSSTTDVDVAINDGFDLIDVKLVL